MGSVYTAGILAELGAIDRFDKGEESVAKFAGLTWRRHQTGDFEADNRPLSKTGKQVSPLLPG